MKERSNFYKFLKKRIKAFDYAFQGVWQMIKTQRNAWIHLIATFCAISLSIIVKINANEWLWITLAIIIVWMAESFNTAIEVVVDLVSPDLHRLAKIAKDCAAGGVLFAAIGAAIIGFIIFLPKIISLF